LFVKRGEHGWRFDYSIGGVAKLLSLGTCADTGLAAVRKKADHYRRRDVDDSCPTNEANQGRQCRRAGSHRSSLDAGGRGIA
jgi:hypothetical protein